MVFNGFRLANESVILSIAIVLRAAVETPEHLSLRAEEYIKGYSLCIPGDFRP